jgi:ankyrin repeat protein
VLGAADVDCSSVHEAAQCSHLGCLQSLLQQPSHAVAAVLQLADDQQTPLHRVRHFTAHCTAVTAALIDSLTQQQQLTAVINRTDNSGHTALRHTVVERGNSTHACHGCVRLLLAAGADIIADEWKPDILSEIISETSAYDDSCHAELTVQALAQRGLDIDQQDVYGRTRLQQLALTVSEGCWSTARSAAVAAAMSALLANGASAKVTDREGNTPLHILANMMEDEYDSLCSADELWSCSCEAAIRAVYDSAGAECLAVKNSYGDTPLHLAAQWPGLAQLLLTLGADVHAVNAAGKTPLHVAAAHGIELSAQLLLDAGAGVSAAANRTGLQPLHCAARERMWQVCRLLLDRGADANATTAGGMSVARCALQHCVSFNDRWSEPVWQFVQVLVEAGADVEQYSERFGTLLHSSASIKCAAVTQYLLDSLLPRDADAPDVLNKVDLYGKTALHLAAACDNAAVVKLLLGSGASVHLDSGPLLHTCLSSDDSSMGLETCTMLLDAGASVVQLDGLG